MEQSRPRTSRAFRLMLTTCLALASDAFQSQQGARHDQRRSMPSATTTSSLRARKGNRGPRNDVSFNTAKRTRPQVNDVLDSISSPPEFPHSVDPSAVPPGPVESDPLAPLVNDIVRAADMRKASDVVAMRVTQCSSLTEFVVIATGTSRPQNQAIAAAVANDVEELYDGKRCIGKGVPEGTADSGWILLDYGEVMVHVMTPKSRLFYDMEGQWKERGGEYMDLSDVLLDEGMMNKVGNALEVGLGDGNEEEGGEGPSMKERLDVEKEIDPFWS